MSVLAKTAAALAILVGIAACGGDKPTIRDAAVDAPIDAGGEVDIDASVDAATALPAYEITGGAGGLHGARYSADVQIGHGFGQAPVANGTKQAEGNAAVKP